MLSKLRIALAAILVAVAAGSAVDSASADGPVSYDCEGLVLFGSP
jgi:hypothetical protein